VTKRVLIFGGTIEGRELACALADRGHGVCVSVATEAGVRAMPDDSRITVRCGALEHGEMLSLMASFDVVVDATHPYARDISEHVARSARESEVACIRIVRPPSDTAGCTVVGSVEEAVRVVGEEGNVLATTGSRQISTYAALSGFEQRLFARVLDEPSSVEACLEAGIPRSHILAKSGPFSIEENLADIDACAACFLVTKDSGDAGGYPEKLAACRARGIEMIVVERPHEEGVSVDEAIDLISGALLTGSKLSQGSICSKEG
jgi:precorrin-6A/cobalt-precorrin-6A reductase